MPKVEASGASTATVVCPAAHRLFIIEASAFRASTNTTPVPLTIAEESVGAVFETEVVNGFHVVFPKFEFAAGAADRDFTIACAGLDVALSCHAIPE
jgi:hypothetical protein